MNATVHGRNAASGVRLITLDRPDRLNAINPALLDALVTELNRANADPAVGSIVLTGAGRAFCAGDDLKEFADQVGDEAFTTAYVERIQDVTRAIVLGEKPVVGAIRGWAVGGGLEWVINCDFAIAAEGTRFFFPEVSWGLFVTGGVTDLLPRLVGLQRARRLMMLGEKFDADQALQWGLLTEVVPGERVLPDALALAAHIASLPPGPVRDMKRILARRSPAALDIAMSEETAATVRGFLDPQTLDRVRTFGR